LIVTDDAAHAPQETQVLFRQRLGWVVLLAAYLAVLCLPAHRALILDQFPRAFAQGMPGWMRAANGEPGPSREALRRTAQRYPQEREIRLGAVLLRATPEQEYDTPAGPAGAGIMSDPRVRACEAIRARFPDDPAVTAQLLRYVWLRGSTIHRVSLGDPSDGELVSRADLERLRSWCRDGARMDPQNGFFPTILAVAEFGARNDEAGLAALHAASVCETWHDYAYTEGSGARALLIRTFGDRGFTMHALPMAAVLLPHLQRIRMSARIASSHADQKRAGGDPGAEHRIRADVIRLGSLIRRNADTLIARLVGTAFEQIGFGTSRQMQGLFRKDEREKVRARARVDYLHRVEREAPEFAAEIGRELRLLEKFEETKEWYLADSAPFKALDNLIDREGNRDVFGLTLLPNLAVSLLLWVVTALLVAIPWPGGRQISLARWVLSEATPAARVGVVAALGICALLNCFWTWTTAPGGWIYLLGVAVVLGLLVSLPCSGRKAEGGWSAASLGAVLVLTVVPLTLVALNGQLGAWWHSQVPAFALLGGEGATDPDLSRLFWVPTGTLLAVLAPLSVLLVAAVRRRTLWQTMNGLRLTFKVLAAVGATLYLGYVLVATPASARDARLWDATVARESSGNPI
jgi:hypothetical protein